MELNPAFSAQMAKILPPEELTDFMTSLQETASVSVRINGRKCPDSALDGGDMVPWCERGMYLSERAGFIFDPLWHAGAYYVQDASSMIIQTIIQRLALPQDTGLRYLDLCAAPGGKTTAAIDALPDGTLVVANEIMSARAQVLKENLIKWGYNRCIVTSDDSARFSALRGYFDIIAADVPCSGEGMFRKDEEAVSQWTPSLVDECVQRQLSIVRNAWSALRDGGIFIYSTCTYNRLEDEQMVEHICKELGAESIAMDFPTEWNIHPSIDTPHHCYRFMPHCTRGEGLFVCVLRKAGDSPHADTELPSKKKSARSGKAKMPITPVPKSAKALTAIPLDLSIEADEIYGIEKSISGDVQYLADSLNVIYKGIHIGSLKGKDIIPSTALALSILPLSDDLPVVDVDYTNAVAYLRGESISIDAPKGFCVINYKGFRLGFVKNLGNRANNLYPKQWRIKSTHIPETPPHVLSL